MWYVGEFGSESSNITTTTGTAYCEGANVYDGRRATTFEIDESVYGSISLKHG